LYPATNGFSLPVAAVSGASQVRTTPSAPGFAARPEGGSGTSMGTIVAMFERSLVADSLSVTTT
jgi:hypothetical protein